jgi:hypothetical protein
MPIIKRTVQDWAEWLIEKAPKDGDSIYEALDKLGMLGSMIDWHLQLETDTEWLKRARPTSRHEEAARPRHPQLRQARGKSRSRH